VNGILKLQRNDASARSVTLSLILGVLGCFIGSDTAHAYVLKNTRTGHRVRWAVPVVTMYVDPKLVEYFGNDTVNASLTIATEAWRVPNVPEIVISDKAATGYQSAQRTNGIYLMNPWPFAKEQLAVTVSTYDLDGQMIGADVLVNGESQYALLPDGHDHPGMTQHDLAAVLTHEMGHVLGLDESPNVEHATMYPFIRGGDVHQRKLTDDDEQGVTEVYRDADFETGAGGCTQASVVGNRAPSDALQLLCLVMAAAWVGRRHIVRRPRG
jgi:hypothetical protein